MSNVRRHKSTERLLGKMWLAPANAVQLQRLGKLSTQLGRVRLRRIQKVSSLQAQVKVPHVAVLPRRVVARQRSHTKSVQAARPASWRAAHLRGGSDEWKLNNTCSSTFWSGTLSAFEKKNAKHKLTEFARVQAGFRGATP